MRKGPHTPPRRGWQCNGTSENWDAEEMKSENWPCARRQNYRENYREALENINQKHRADITDILVLEKL